MSNSSRINKATSELNKAEERLLNSLGLSDELIDYLSDVLKSGEIAKNLERIIDSDILTQAEYNAVHRLQESFRVSGGLTSAINAYYQNGSSAAVISGALDFSPEILKGIKRLGLISEKIATRAIPVVGQALLVLDALNLIDKYLFNNSKLFDLKNHLSNFYDKLTNTSSELPDVRNGVISITMPNGETYERPIQNEILKRIYGTDGNKFSLTGENKDDVLFGGSGDDMLNGHAGSDILIGGAGKDDYFVDNGDTIKDSDGKGRVFLSSTNIQLTGGTQIEKGSKIYKGKDGTKYEISGYNLIINDNITIENFSKISNDLDIVLVDVDDIVVTIGNNQSTEGGNGKHSMEFKITLNRALKEDENLSLLINGQIIKFSPNDIEQTYTYEWEGNETKDEDRKFEVGGFAMINGTSENLNVQAIVSGQDLIKDDDKDPNDDKPETYDPLVIDLNNDGIKDTNLDYKINFDLDNNGFKEATSWIDNNDAFIAIDKNNNGTIDNGSELFGNKSISNNAYAYTNPNAKNGFESLKELDSNNDDIINEKDKEFTNLLLWQDKNSNGISETDELIKLSDKAEFANLNLLVA